MGDGDGKAPATGSFTTNQPPSPGSETASHPPESQAKEAHANGAAKSSKLSLVGFDLYCDEARPALEAKNKNDDEDLSIEDELKKGWEELAETEKEEYETNAEQVLEVAKDQEKEHEQERKLDLEQDRHREQAQEAQSQKDDKPNGAKHEAPDEDVEMGNYDTEDQETQAEEKTEE